jgi:DNA-binding response OmpR family regulator
VTVSGLRQRLADAEREAGSEAPSIETIRGVGYRLAHMLGEEGTA